LPFHFKFILNSVTKHINVRLYSLKHYDAIIPLNYLDFFLFTVEM
jgi:hypothetical protein